MPTLQPYKNTTYYFWKYIPSLPASIIFLVLYSIIFCLISWRMWKTKTWFCTSFVVGCIMEVIGFTGRAFATNSTGLMGPYIIQAVFILLPPAFFAATIYTCLSRLIRLLHASHLSPIRPLIITRIFVLGDLMSINVQDSASGLWSHQNLVTIATALVVLGLATQLISFLLFLLCAVVFHLRMRQNPTPSARPASSPSETGTREGEGEIDANPKWLPTMHMLYTISILIFIRSIFRIVEFLGGQDGYLLRHEWTLYVFDGIPMFVVCVVFFVAYPSHLAAAQRAGDDEAALELVRRGTGDEEEVEVGAGMAERKRMGWGRGIGRGILRGFWGCSWDLGGG